MMKRKREIPTREMLQHGAVNKRELGAVRVAAVAVSNITTQRRKKSFTGSPSVCLSLHHCLFFCKDLLRGVSA
jgi:hypothetical protein